MNTCVSMRSIAANEMGDRVHVAVAVIQSKDGRMLISKRPTASHQGGLWEFPGGKVEQGESTLAALKRELLEETGLVVLTAEPLLTVSHDYADKAVLLDVWRVTSFAGNAAGFEGQEVRWVELGDLSAYEFPAANQSTSPPHAAHGFPGSPRRSPPCPRTGAGSARRCD